jgi:hypothetical protein
LHADFLGLERHCPQSVGLGMSGSEANRATPALRILAGAAGAIAIGAMAIGALAIARLAVGRLVVGKARVGELEIGRLTVRRLQVVGQSVSRVDHARPVRRIAGRR